MRDILPQQIAEEIVVPHVVKCTMEENGRVFPMLRGGHSGCTCCAELCLQRQGSGALRKHRTWYGEGERWSVHPDNWPSSGLCAHADHSGSLQSVGDRVVGDRVGLEGWAGTTRHRRPKSRRVPHIVEETFEVFVDVLQDGMCTALLPRGQHVDARVAHQFFRKTPCSLASLLARGCELGLSENSCWPETTSGTRRSKSCDVMASIGLAIVVSFLDKLGCQRVSLGSDNEPSATALTHEIRSQNQSHLVTRK